MKTSEILAKAKKYLWDGTFPRELDRYSYICFAVEHALFLDLNRARPITQEIMLRIDPHGSVHSWLMIQGVSADDLTTRNVQAWRHAWLDMLIAEYQQKGD